MYFMWLMPWKTIAVDCIDSFHFTYLKLEAYEVSMQIYAKWMQIHIVSHESWHFPPPPRKGTAPLNMHVLHMVLLFSNSNSASSQINPNDSDWATNKSLKSFRNKNWASKSQYFQGQQLQRGSELIECSRI